MSAPLRKVSAAAPRAYPLIGSRWTPETVERRDTERGTYEMVNSKLETRTEILVQRALLRAVKR